MREEDDQDSECSAYSDREQLAGTKWNWLRRYLGEMGICNE